MRKCVRLPRRRGCLAVWLVGFNFTYDFAGDGGGVALSEEDVADEVGQGVSFRPGEAATASATATSESKRRHAGHVLRHGRRNRSIFASRAEGEVAIELPGEWPGSVRPVRYHCVRGVGLRVVNRPE